MYAMACEKLANRSLDRARDETVEMFFYSLNLKR